MMMMVMLLMRLAVVVVLMLLVIRMAVMKPIMTLTEFVNVMMTMIQEKMMLMIAMATAKPDEMLKQTGR